VAAIGVETGAVADLTSGEAGSVMRAPSQRVRPVAARLPQGLARSAVPGEVTGIAVRVEVAAAAVAASARVAVSASPRARWSS
jgi:hypothetical protein